MEINQTDNGVEYVIRSFRDLLEVPPSRREQAVVAFTAWLRFVYAYLSVCELDRRPFDMGLTFHWVPAETQTAPQEAEPLDNAAGISPALPDSPLDASIAPAGGNQGTEGHAIASSASAAQESIPHSALGDAKERKA